MRLVRIKLKNFLSFRELDHSFVNGPLLVQGRNLSEPESKETNGSGKSTLEAGIAYALFASALRKQTLDRELITWGESEAEIWLYVECPMRKQTLAIHRTLRVKGSASLELFINDEAVSFATVNDGNAYIIRWVGISVEDLKNYYILNKENYRSFITASNTDKLALINRFIKVERLDEADSVINEEVKPLQAEADELSSRMYRIEGQIKAYSEQLQAERERNTDAEKQSIIEGIEGQIDSVLAKYDRAKERIKECRQLIAVQHRVMDEKNAAIDAATEELKQLNSTDWRGKVNKVESNMTAMSGELDKVQKEERQIASSYYDATAKIAKLNSLLESRIVCPNCKHEFVLNSEMSVAEINKAVDDANLNVESIEKRKAECSARKENINARMKKFNDEFMEFRRKEKLSLEQVRRVEGNITSLKRAVVTAEAEKEQYLKEMDSLTLAMQQYDKESELLAVQLEKAQNSVIETREKEIEGLLVIAEKQKEKLQAQIDEVNNCISDMRQWGQRFKEFRMSLAVEQLKLIQDAANLSLQKQHSELRLSIDGFKVNAKGQVKSEITVLVINGEGEYKSFWSFSGGERARIEMALIQAFQEMINATNPYGGLHFLMIDEVLEGTDPLGLALLLESLQEVESPVYVISHVMNIRAGINTMTVVKEDGYSRVEMNVND